MPLAVKGQVFADFPLLPHREDFFVTSVDLLDVVAKRAVKLPVPQSLPRQATDVSIRSDYPFSEDAAPDDFPLLV